MGYLIVFIFGMVVGSEYRKTKIIPRNFDRKKAGLKGWPDYEI